MENENKAQVIIKALKDKLKSDKQKFGEIASYETYGVNGARMDIAMELDGKFETFSVIVIKYGKQK